MCESTWWPSEEALEWPCASAATLYVTKALSANTPTANAERDFLPIATLFPEAIRPALTRPLAPEH